MTRPSLSAHASARANIALAKYWGKVDTRLNLPAVPSISLTLDQLVTKTEVTFDPARSRDGVILDGKRLSQRAAERVVRVLDTVRKEAKLAHRALVRTENHFPTAAGLASSASGFAALVAAARKAAKLPDLPHVTSACARQASASAARSVYGGFVELPAGKRGEADLCAKPLCPEGHWDVRLVIALTTTGKKAVGSTEGMERSRKTSPLYDAWVAHAPRLARRVRKGILQRDLKLVGEAMEQSTMAFHSCAHSSNPPIVYWKPGTLSALDTIFRLRARGVPVYATMDAGPHVKALCHKDDAAKVKRALSKNVDVLDVLVCAPGKGIELLP